LYVAISRSNEIYASIKDADFGFFTGNIRVGTRPQGVAVHPNGTRAHVTTAAGIVGFINTATDTVITNIRVGALAFSAAFLPGGSRAYVAATDAVSSGWVSVTDTAANSIAATIPVPGSPLAVAAQPAGSRVYVTNDLNESGVAKPGLLSLPLLDKSIFQTNFPSLVITRSARRLYRKMMTFTGRL
jgi:YVTN family beta-propeller protein